MTIIANESAPVGADPGVDLAAADTAASPVDARARRAEHILNSAAACLVRWGFRKTTVDDVAREAGVAKGTIYLYWKDKKTLILAALARAQEQVAADLRGRIAADPEGGLPHRLWMHGLFAGLGNPLMAAVMRGQTDASSVLRGFYDPATLVRVTGDYEAYLVHLQEAGLIRADLPVPVIIFLTSALKIGLISAPDLLDADQVPSMEALGEATSDLIRRWLEPAAPPGDETAGKRIVGEWLEKLQAVEQGLQ